MKDVDDPKTADSVEVFRGDAYRVAFIVPGHGSIVINTDYRVAVIVDVCQAIGCCIVFIEPPYIA